MAWRNPMKGKTNENFAISMKGRIWAEKWKIIHSLSIFLIFTSPSNRRVPTRRINVSFIDRFNMIYCLTEIITRSRHKSAFFDFFHIYFHNSTISLECGKSHTFSLRIPALKSIIHWNSVVEQKLQFFMFFISIVTFHLSLNIVCERKSVNMLALFPLFAGHFLWW